MELHCVICYEEFNLKDRHPVVLPCGHTYLCEVCAKKIKICHQCREPLYWKPPIAQNSALNNHNHNSHSHRSPATSRYSRYNHNRYSPSTPPHPSAGAKPEKREEVQLPCPKNVVLMEMIEAKQRQERLVSEQKARNQQKKEEKQQERQRRLQQRLEEKENKRRSRQAELGSGRSEIMQLRSDDSEEIEVDIKQTPTLLDDDEDDDDDLEFDYDDEISSSSSSGLPLGGPELVSGYAALSGTCGTYAVRDPDGLVVLSQDPNRPKYRVTKRHGDEKKDGSDHSETHFSSIFNSNDDDDDDEDLRSSFSSKEPFTIEEGQKVQVVGIMQSNEQGVYQLARGAGFVVATANQLVKVGGPEETSCKMEGMLQSILEKQKEMQRKLDEMTQLAIGLTKQIIKEQDKPEAVPVISIPIRREVELSLSNTDESNNDAATVSSHANFIGTAQYPRTPTRVPQSFPGSPRSGDPSVASTEVNLGLSPITPSRTQAYYTGGQQGEYVNSPARSCPIPSHSADAVHLNQPFLDVEAPASTGVLRYRVNNDDETSGLGWAGVLGCGTSLFGERLLESSDTGAANTIFNTATSGNNDILRLPFDQNAIMQHTNVQRRAAALAAVASGNHSYRGIGLLEGSGSADSPLRRGGSFDGGTINFRTGMSGHSGLGKPKRDFTCDQHLTYHNADGNAVGFQQPRRSKMSQMSQHRGAATVRLGHRTSAPSLQRRGNAPDALLGCQTIR